MKAKWLALMVAMLAELSISQTYAAIRKPLSDAPAREFVFVENNSDDNFFVTPGGALIRV